MPGRRRPDASLAGRAWTPLPGWNRVPLWQRVLTGAVIAVSLVAVAGLGWGAGGLMGHDVAPAPPPAPHGVAVGSVRVSLPGTWAPRPLPAWLPAGALRNPTAFAPLRSVPAVAALGTARPSDRSLMPEALRKLLASPLPAPRAASLGGRAAWAYRELRLRDGRRADVVIAPSSGDSLVLVCAAPQPWWSAAAGCESAIGVLSAPAPVVPSARLAARRVLPGVIATLNGRLQADARRMRAARQPQGQAAAARALAAAHETARRSLTTVLAPSSPILAALARSERRYRWLANAAANRYARSYRRHARTAHRADAALSRALQRLG